MHKQVKDILAELMAADQHRGKPISANALAQATGVSQPTITRILNGESLDPDSATLAPLARYFDVTIAELRGEQPLITDKKIRRVVVAMQTMAEYEKDAVVKISDTLVERKPPSGTVAQ